MVQAMDQGAIEEAMDGASGGSRMVQAMGQKAIGGAMDGAINGSQCNRRSDGCCKRLIREMIECYKSIICDEMIIRHKCIICDVVMERHKPSLCEEAIECHKYFFVTLHITLKPFVQFCNFPQYVFKKDTKTTDFFVTAVSQ